MNKIKVFSEQELSSLVEQVTSYNERFLVGNIINYLHSKDRRVLALYGLRRTGKTVSMLHAIRDVGISNCTYINCYEGASFDDLIDAMQRTSSPYVFVDEITYCDYFSDEASWLSSLFTECGRKVVIAGTYSLGIDIAEGHELLGRMIRFNTTFCSYREYKYLHADATVDDYLRTGTVLQPTAFLSVSSCKSYIDDAIVNNIIHSMVNSDNLYYCNLLRIITEEKLPEVIYKCINKVSTLCSTSTIVRLFKETSISAASRNLHIKVSNNYAKVTGFTSNFDESPEKISACIREILQKLNIIGEVSEYNIPQRLASKRGILLFPGMQYRLSMGCLSSLAEEYPDTPIKEKAPNILLGLLLEDCILRNTLNATTVKFSNGEFDMVTYSPSLRVCHIYEIKHSDKIVPEQYKYLINEDLIKQTEEVFGKVLTRTVLYMGPSTTLPNGIKYKNVEDYLLGR